MQRHPEYTCSFTSPVSPKFSASHSTSSAFSASANPNEDWTKISDLAERRRIQNRIAQRNYRKKIKRKLEDLERRAASPSASPEQMHAELTTAPRPGQRGEGLPKRHKPKNNNNKVSGIGRQPSPEYMSNHHSPGFDHRSAIFQPMREFSTSPPPPFGYSYPLPDPGTPAPYPQHTSFQTLPASYPDYDGQSCYLPPLPTTLPSMPSYELGQGKHDIPLGDDGMLGQFNHPIPYAPFSSLDIPHTQSYQDSNAHTPPLSHSHSFEFSRAGSPSIIFPGTPVSVPGSPPLIIR